MSVSLRRSFLVPLAVCAMGCALGAIAACTEETVGDDDSASEEDDDGAKKDGGKADAGKADGGKADGGVKPPSEPLPLPPAPATAAKCGDEGLLFCEDFEALEAGPAEATDSWKPSASGAPVSISDEAPTREGKALHIQSKAGADGTIEVADFTPPDNSYFGRMFVYVDKLPTAPNYAHWVLAEMGGTGNTEVIRPIGGQYIEEMGDAKGEGLNMFGPGSDGGNTKDWTNWQPSAPFVAGEWTCLEWEVRDGSETAINIWIDGAEKEGLNITGSNRGHDNLSWDGAANMSVKIDEPLEFPTFNKIKLGWTIFQPVSVETNLYLDDIALGSQRLGCPE